MKKTFNLILCMLCSLLSMAQSNPTEFAPDGAEWWHGNLNFYDIRDDNNITSSYFTIHSFMNEDTIINNTQVKVINPLMYINSYHTPLDSVTLDPLYVYATEDTVFIYNTYFDKFTPLYVFNVEEGDTICLPVIPHPFYTPNFNYWYHPIAEQDSFFCVKVDSVRMVLYDEEYLETVFTSEITGWDNELLYPAYNYSQGVLHEEYYWGHKSGYARKIGSLSSFLLPAPSEAFIVIGGQLDTISLGSSGLGFRCYSDENININMHLEQGCDFIKTINIEEIATNNSVMVYPNPASDQIYFTLPNDVQEIQVELFDNLGRVVLQATLKRSDPSLDISKIPAGLYVLKIKVNEQETYQKVLIH